MRLLVVDIGLTHHAPIKVDTVTNFDRESRCYDT